eukprot:112993-Amphidinium_carterae.1
MEDEMFQKINWALMDKRIDTTLGGPQRLSSACVLKKEHLENATSSDMTKPGLNCIHYHAIAELPDSQVDTKSPPTPSRAQWL